MKQLVDCVGMSARKKVLESGRKPRVIGVWSLGGKSGIKGEGMRKGSYKKELRFDPLATPIPRPDYSALGPSSETNGYTCVVAISQFYDFSCPESTNHVSQILIRKE
jgi:hypothetical protein